MTISYIFAAFGGACKPQGGFLLGFPHWYEYLNGIRDASGKCVPSIVAINDVWLIVAAAIEILIRVAAVLAVVMIVYGGFSYVTSQGEPEATAKAKGTLINALVGLVIAVSAASIISFIAKNIN